MNLSPTHRVLVFGAKPYMSKVTAPHLVRKYPGAQITVVHDMFLGLAKPSVPRGIKASEYPVTINLEWEPIPQDDQGRLRFAEIIVTAEHPEGISRQIHASGLNRTELSDLVKRSDTVVFVSDPDHSSARNFISFLRIYGPPGQHELDVEAIALNGLDDFTIKKAFAHPYSFQAALGKAALYGEMKAYFDVNFYANAYYVFGSLLRKLSLGFDKFPISKFSLQLLIYVSQLDHPLTEGDIQWKMHNWTGTGRYPMTNMGSAASRSAILQILLKGGLMQEYLGPDDGKRYLTLSDAGSAFVSMLHPDCWDADLPSRLHEWCSEATLASKVKIDRYIRTFFGKQLAFARKRGLM